MRTALLLLATLAAPLLVAAPAAAGPVDDACDALDCNVEACTPPVIRTGSGWSRVCADYPPDGWCPLYVADAQGNFWSCLLPHGVRASADHGLPQHCQHVFSAPDVSYYQVCVDGQDLRCMVYTESGAVWGTHKQCLVGLP